MRKRPNAGKIQFRKATLNLFAFRQDDHNKTGSFLQNDIDNWHPAIFRRTFSSGPMGEHRRSDAGHSKPTFHPNQRA